MENKLGGLKLEKVIYIKVVDEVMVEKMAKNTAQGKKTISLRKDNNFNTRVISITKHHRRDRKDKIRIENMILEMEKLSKKKSRNINQIGGALRAE